MTANPPFGEWNEIRRDPAMTLAAIDRLVHRSTLFELDVESHRYRAALHRRQHGPGRPAPRAAPARQADRPLGLASVNQRRHQPFAPTFSSCLSRALIQIVSPPQRPELPRRPLAACSFRVPARKHAGR